MSLTPPEFDAFPKIKRFSRNIIVTEKIDGTNATVFIDDDGDMHVASRNRWITTYKDNAGFANWAEAHKYELLQLGPGWHRGEWWGSGIQRGYGLPKGEKRFSLFNTHRWGEHNPPPACCHVVPVLATHMMHSGVVADCLSLLAAKGSLAAPGFMNPEGIIIYHTADCSYSKKTLDDDGHKGDAHRAANKREAVETKGV